MSPYPTEITNAILNQHAHIPDAVIRIDIADTQSEIKTLTQEVEGLRLIVDANIGKREYKMDSIRLFAKEEGIRSRTEFIEFLQKLLTARSK